MAGTLRKISIIVLLRPFGSGRADLACIETPTLFRVRQEIIGSRNFLELLLRMLVAGIEIRMMLLRQTQIGFFDVCGRCCRGDAKDMIRVFHCSSSSPPLSELAVNTCPYRKLYPPSVKPQI